MTNTANSSWNWTVNDSQVGSLSSWNWNRNIADAGSAWNWN